MLTLVIITLIFSVPGSLLVHGTAGSSEDNAPIIVHVVRLDREGRPFPHHLSFRHKGQVPFYGINSYRVESLNRTWIYELRPSFQSHRLVSSAIDARSLLEAGCYYSGQIRGEAFSSINVSLCEGMTGDIRTSSGEYVIYPMDNRSSSSFRHHLSHLHFADPHRRWRPLAAKKLHFCDVEDNSLNYTEQVHLNLPPVLSRKRRSESRELHLEVLVVADSQMASYHGSNLEHYILTLMSMVALIYKHPSIGNNINIAVIDIVVLNETADNEIIHHIAPVTLRKFCEWQERHNAKDDRDPSHYDTAILITRQDLCRYSGACDTLGLAQSGMVCDSYSSCAIVEDNGISAAFTLAHELGHIMSIPHDDDNKCSRYHHEKKKLHVMARMLDYNSDPYSWSVCSREYLTTFFDVGYGHCLMDKPGRNRLLEDDQFLQSPGQLYAVDRQCELVFGPRSRVCPYMPECKRLWCTMDDTTQGGCRTQHMPWADGSSCGTSGTKRCFQGECERYRHSGVTPVDGQWGEWTNYGTCSRTCGGGIQQAVRECNSPKPAFGGRYCTGIRIRYKSCNTEECLDKKADFRAQQCEEFNGRHLNIPGVPTTVEYIPYYNNITPHEKCKLYCKIKGSASFYVLSEKVVDGTRCELGSFDICVNGNCEPAGCDHILHSKKALDRCGVCGGNNSTCREISGHFNNIVDYGYHNVILIPPGASNIIIEQISLDNHIDDNYIALKDPDGIYILNGEFMITMFPKKLHYHGITIDYSGSSAIREYVNSSQPLSTDLFVQVLIVGKLQPPNIRFSYTVPLSQNKLYSWRLATQFSECTRLCNGTSSLRPVCIRSSDNYLVSDGHCSKHSKPNSQKVRRCNEHCQLKWQIVGRSACSSSCGNGISVRIIKCMKINHSTKISHAVPEEHCMHLGPKPNSEEKCKGICHNTKWFYSDWSRCSVTCGKGTQYRASECRNNMNQKQSDEHCDASSRISARICQEVPCPHWGVGEWTDCSVTCGIGIRQRLYWCQQGDKYVNEKYCIGGDIQPLAKEECNPGDCYEWHVGEWGPCSATCGAGLTERSVYCHSISEPLIEDFKCGHLKRPPYIKNCTVPCSNPINQNGNLNIGQPVTPRILSDTISISEFKKAVWKHGEWSECSVTCGEGVKRRQVVCFTGDGSPSFDCDSNHKPIETSECNFRPCPNWSVGEWSGCSVSCGEGLQVRSVNCTTEDGEVHPESYCNPIKMPKNEKICMFQACNEYKWLNGPWSQCSISCGSGTQQREVYCLNSQGHHVNPENCPKPSPIMSQSCFSSVCPVWQWSEWSQCPKSCAFYEQNRYSHCIEGDRIVPDDHCFESKPPPERRKCKLPIECSFKWHKGIWSQCHIPCGTSYKFREIVCTDHEGNRVADEFCASKPRPREKKKCDLKPCPYAWKASNWSECSKSCDEGIQRRQITCHQVNAYGWLYPSPVNPSYCGSFRKPKDIEKCNYGYCSSGFVWRPNSWQPCVGPCNSAKQKRKSGCYSLKGGTRVSNYRCDKSLKPKKRRKCNWSQECPPKNCLDIFNFQNKGVDGDYQIEIKGKMVTIYCKDLSSSHPQEYINLVSNNFAMIHSPLLSSEFSITESCHNNNIINTCDCTRKDQGYTIFFKIALNITSMTIILDDFTFANTYYGKPVPYGTAGDCLRRPNCLLGAFSISLENTDFTVASNTRWSSKAGRAHATIHRTKNNQVVKGKCGGFCDVCTPDPHSGLIVDVLMPS